jgi:hypothetical protein
MKIVSGCPPTTSHTSVQVSKVDDETPAGHSVTSHKPNYTKANLPFPPGGNHHQIWGKSFRPAFLSWAGSQDNPFGMNGRMHNEISGIWQHLYPDIKLDNEKMKILVDMVHYSVSLHR